MIRSWILGTIVGSFMSLTCFANEIIQVEGDTIRGNEEQPKVTHIVPWQTHALELPLENRSYEHVKSQLLKPISRQQILREQGKINETLNQSSE